MPCRRLYLRTMTQDLTDERHSQRESVGAKIACILCPLWHTCPRVEPWSNTSCRFPAEQLKEIQK